MGIRLNLHVGLGGVLLALLLAAGPLLGQIPGVSPSEKSSNKEQGQSAVPVPDPLSLRGDWWRYFSVEDAELEKRITEIQARLAATITKLPAGQDDVRNLVQRVHANLAGLAAARALKSPPEPPMQPYLEAYNIEQLLAKARELRDAEAELRRDSDAMARTIQGLKLSQKRRDNLFASYLELAPEDPQRLLRGLEIMVDRSALAIVDERQRLKKASQKNLEQRVKWLTGELAAAGKRLTVAASDLKTIDSDLKDANARLNQARDQQLDIQTKAMEAAGEGAAGKAEAQIRDQGLVRSAVDTALHETLVARLEAMRELVVLLNESEEETDFVSMRERLNGWDSLLTTMNEKLQFWRETSTYERGHAGESLAALTSAENTDKEAIKLNQNRLKLAQDTLVILAQAENAMKDLKLLGRQLEERLRQREGLVKAWLDLTWVTMEDIWDRGGEWMGYSLFKMGDTPVTSLGLLRVVLILTIAWWASYLFRRAVGRLAEGRESASSAALYTLGRLAHYVIFIIGLVVALSSIGIDFSNFALVAGALSVGIGFGLQSVVNNFVSGLILLFERTVKVGDFLELDTGVTGTVKEINVRSTVINTNDNVDIVVPNSEMVSKQLTNWTLREAHRRIHIPFGVAYGTDKDLVRKAVLEAAKKVPYTLEGRRVTDPQVWLVNFGESSLDFELVVWILASGVKRPGTVHAAYLWEIESALGEHGIEIPFPQRDLHLRSGFDQMSPGQDLAETRG